MTCLAYQIIQNVTSLQTDQTLGNKAKLVRERAQVFKQAFGENEEHLSKERYRTGSYY